MKSIKLGLIGASQICDRIMPSIMKVAEIDVVAIASLDENRRTTFADKWKIPKRYETYDELFEAKNIDATYISTLNSSHFNLIVKCLNSGKHVLCEKPLVLNFSEAVQAFEISKKNNLILLEGLMYRFHPQIQEVLSFASSAIGQIQNISIDFSFLLYDQNDFSIRTRATKIGGGGALNDLGCYGIDFLNQLTELDNPISCDTIMKLVNGIDTDVVSHLKYSDELSARLHFSVVQPSLNNWEIGGARGSVAALRFDSQGDSSVPIYKVDEESRVTLEMCESIDCFEAEFRNFANSILGREKPHIRPEESIFNSKLLEHIRMAGTI